MANSTSHANACNVHLFLFLKKNEVSGKEVLSRRRAISVKSSGGTELLFFRLGNQLI